MPGSPAENSGEKSRKLFDELDLDGKLLSFVWITLDSEISMIADLCPAADWVERERLRLLGHSFKDCWIGICFKRLLCCKREGICNFTSRPGKPLRSER